MHAREGVNRVVNAVVAWDKATQHLVVCRVDDGVGSKRGDVATPEIELCLHPFVANGQQVRDVRDASLGDTRGKAKALTWKKTTTGSIDGNKDSDFFKFKAPKTRNYTITVKNASCSEHIEAYITDKYEEELARDTWVSKNYQLSKEIKLVKGQTYFIQVVGSTGTGNYKVTVK